VADPKGPWQLELQMPENRMGYIAKAQQLLYAKSRERLRELLREEAKSKLGDSATEEDIAKEIDASLAVVLDEKLHEQILAIDLQRLRDAIKPIAAGATDEKLREAINAVLAEKTYDAARVKLKDLIAELQKTLVKEPPATPPETAPAAVTTTDAAATPEAPKAASAAKEPESKEPEKTSEAATTTNAAKASEEPNAVVDAQEALRRDLLAKLQALPNVEELDDRLEVSYILATEPGTVRYGRIAEMHRSAEVRGDEGNTVLIKVAIDKMELPLLRPGASVTAQVYCGQTVLGYSLLHDVIAFIQSRILFRYF
jgi:hypothetical protein